MEKTDERRKAFLFGFVSLLLCGVGDWLIGYEPQGGQPVLFGISSTSITGVPAWFYILSLFFGILSGFGCRAFAPQMLEVIVETGISRDSKAYRAFRFGLSSAPMMFVSFHAVCCVTLLLMQASLRAGLDMNAADKVFLIPVAASLVPFLIWCMLCDVPVTVSYVYLVLKGWLRVRKGAVICCPLMMSLLAKVLAAVLIAAGSPLAFLAACGESWGWAFMCLVFYRLSPETGKEKQD